MNFRVVGASLLLFSLLTGGCGGGSGSGSDTTTNQTPVANAGLDQTVATGSLVTLDGSGSTDADGDALSYVWTMTDQPVGSMAGLSSSTVFDPSFTADVEGTYQLQLVVDDGEDASDPDTVLITAVTAAGFLPPADHVAVNFTIDDTANQSYLGADGLAWKGSFNFDPSTRILSLNGAWGGPYPMLYDDGPWDSGGHEPLGSIANDGIWGVTAWVPTTATQTFEYGAIRGSVNGSDGNWIWIGSNGTFTVTSGATMPIDAPGLVVPMSVYTEDAYACILFSGDSTGFAGVDLGTGARALITADPDSVGIYAADFVGKRYLGVVYSTNVLKAYASDGTGTTLGTISGVAVNTVVGHTYDARNKILYLSTNEGAQSELYKVNQTTLAATRVGTITSDLIIGIASDATGNLYGVGIVDDRLYTINPLTGSGTGIGTLGIDINYAQDIGFDRTTNVLYGALYQGSGDSGIYRIDVGTGAATLIGTTSGDELAGLAIPY